MMAEPEHAGDEEAQRKGDETGRIESGEFAPSGRRAELRRARQVIASSVIATPKMVLLSDSSRRISKWSGPGSAMLVSQGRRYKTELEYVLA